MKPENGQQLLTTAELAARWSMSAGTLRNWRSQGVGPSFIRLRPRRKTSHPRIRYRMKDILNYERR